MNNINNKPVADVGMFNTTKPSFSKETQNMLKTLMDEAHLTHLQRRQFENSLRTGEPLPVVKKSAKNKKSLPKAVSAKYLNPKNYKCSLKSFEQIKASNAYEREKYEPSPSCKFGGCYEKDKQRLSNIFAYGEDIDPKNKNINNKNNDNNNKNNNNNNGDYDDDSDGHRKGVDRFYELEQEIEDRRNFLDKMTKLGRVDEYKNKIETEISQMIREMELIDKKRSAVYE
ncbi:hypothetical protein HELRODRAFT_174523 [Helobdella robusta]|uniref:Uncharacterized protein n=1 Tax=Helobdella robusta TaxID=6412 RepID=T1F880_HELRO|nr:hypothetical protein HELRODRAFT_174523 [Helobdella robusta]ESO01562.1 hypothetical protein HELRODRAFT_174523 [Helobdella robusta]